MNARAHRADIEMTPDLFAIDNMNLILRRCYGKAEAETKGRSRNGKQNPESRSQKPEEKKTESVNAVSASSFWLLDSDS
jgi:hypothetical protein